MIKLFLSLCLYRRQRLKAYINFSKASHKKRSNYYIPLRQI